MSNMYSYFEQRTTWSRSLVVNVSDFGARGPGWIRGWASIIYCFLFALFLSVIMLKYFIQVLFDISMTNNSPLNVLY